MTRLSRLSLATLLSLLLSACGGGGGDDTTTSAGSDAPPPPPPPKAAAFEVSAPALSYSRRAVFTVSGTEVAKMSKVTVSKCTGLAQETPPSPDQRAVSCAVSGTGELQFLVKDAADTVLYTATFTVPEPRVTMATNLGTMVIELSPTAAPATATNFLRYVDAGFYNNTLFHRIISGFVAQGGLLNATPAEQPGRRAAIALESNVGLPNLRGTIAMARTSEPNSATSQFYFNLVDNPGLNFVSATQPGYAVFGKIVQGLDVMDKIGASPTGERFGLRDFPVTDVVVTLVQQTQ